MKRPVQIAALLFSILLLPGCAASGNGGIVGEGSTPETEEITFSPANAFDYVLGSAEETLKWAQEHPVAISGEHCSGHEVIEAFFDAANAGKPASVLCAKYYDIHPERMSAELYEEEKDQYPVLYFYLVEYDGKEYRVKTRESSGTELLGAETYPYFVHLTGENTAGALTRYTDEYDLVYDPDVTLDQLWMSIAESANPEPVRFTPVFTDYHD